MGGAIEQALNSLDAGKLEPVQAAEALRQIVGGDAPKEQVKKLLLSLNDPSAEVLAEMARVLRQQAVQVETAVNAVDTCGMGGDRLNWFNISTAAAFVVAGCGVPVAKHGGRAVSSKSGSGDVLTELGVGSAKDGEHADRCLSEVGICFMFAPNFHPAMRHVAPLRKELGVPTFFNMLGPLSNPAGVKRQVVGVPDLAKTQPMANALRLLGGESAMVVNADCGADEVDVQEQTTLYQVGKDILKRRRTRPADFGLPPNDNNLLVAASPQASAKLIVDAFDGAGGEHNAPPTRARAVRHAIAINAAVALLVAGTADSFNDAAQMSLEALDSGAARNKLNQLAQISPVQ